MLVWLQHWTLVTWQAVTLLMLLLPVGGNMYHIIIIIIKLLKLNVQNSTCDKYLVRWEWWWLCFKLWTNNRPNNDRKRKRERENGLSLIGFDSGCYKCKCVCFIIVLLIVYTRTPLTNQSGLPPSPKSTKQKINKLLIEIDSSFMHWSLLSLSLSLYFFHFLFLFILSFSLLLFLSFFFASINDKRSLHK